MLLRLFQPFHAIKLWSTSSSSSTPTLMPTSPTVSLASKRLQGNAMADIARAMPGLTTLSGKDRSIDFMCTMYTCSMSIYSVFAMTYVLWYDVIWCDIVFYGAIRCEFSWFVMTTFNTIGFDFILFYLILFCCDVMWCNVTWRDMTR